MLAKLHTLPTVKAEPEPLPLILLPLISLPTQSLMLQEQDCGSLGTCAEMLFDSSLQMTANIYTYKEENKKNYSTKAGKIDTPTEACFCWISDESHGFLLFIFF